jgi:hypothetical protein
MRVASLSDEFERAASGEERSVVWASPVQDNDFRKLAQAPGRAQANRRPLRRSRGLSISRGEGLSRGVAAGDQNGFQVARCVNLR